MEIEPFEFYGDPSPLSESDYREAAEELRCEAAAIKAVYAVESADRGFYPDRRCVILPEPHKFSHFTDHRYDDSHPEISYRQWRPGNYPANRAEPRYERLVKMMNLDETAALKSCSWGSPQIMGFNRGLCGFRTVEDFVAYMCESEANQLECFVRFVIATGLDDELRERKWERFAAGYNGPGQVEKYARWMRNAYDKAANADRQDPCAEEFPVTEDEIAARPEIPNAHFIPVPPRRAA